MPQGILNFFEAMLSEFKWEDHEWEYYEDLKELVKEVRDRDISEIEVETEEATVKAKTSQEFVSGLEQTAEEKQALKEQKAKA